MRDSGRGASRNFRDALGDLGKLPGLERASVSGMSQQVARLDPRTKVALLAAWDRGDTRPMPLLLRFMDGTGDIQAKLEAQGVVPRTVAGPVVTVDADPETHPYDPLLFRGQGPQDALNLL